MAENSKIEWTDHTFNPWVGCQKISAGCLRCYADAQDRRFGPSHWGPGQERKMMSAAYWRQPLRWNAEAAAAGIRRKVFCASMADVFERLPADHPSAGDQEAAREKLWALIHMTPKLDWLLLTKRPENIVAMVPSRWLHKGFPANVWVGTSVEDQAAADTRIPDLLQVPAWVRFLSCEPLLGPVDLTSWLGFHCSDVPDDSKIHWVIAGGESGHGARPMHPDWARALRDQCQAAGVPFFFKQWGNWAETQSHEPPIVKTGDLLFRSDGTTVGAIGEVSYRDNEHWVGCSAFGSATGVQALLTVPHNENFGQYCSMRNVGKHSAGRVLDGQEWNEMPGENEMPGKATGQEAVYV